MQEKIGKLGATGLIIMLACGFTMSKRWSFDNDAWFLLNCGRYVTEHGIPHEEFATIHAGLHYVMQQWLTAKIFWEIYGVGGTEGLIIFAWLIGFITMFIYYRLCMFVSAGNVKISVMLALFVSLSVAPFFFVTRPQIFSTLILLAEVFLLEKYFAERKLWTLCTLPLLSILLINLHAAMWAMLIVLILPYVAEIFICRKNHTPILPVILAGVAIFAAGFINPYGLEAITYLAHSTDKSINLRVYEMFPALLNTLHGMTFFISAIVIACVYTKKVIPPRYFFLSLGLMLLASQTMRSIFLFFVLGTFPLANALRNWRPFDETFIFPHKLFVPLFAICGVEFIFIFYKLQNSIAELHLQMKIVLGFTMIFLICFTIFYRREGKLFSEEIFILRRKPLIVLATLQVIVIAYFVAIAVPVAPYEHYEVDKPAVDFLLSKNRAEDIILWTGYNNGNYAEFRGIKCYLDTRAEVFISSNNRKKNIFQEYMELVNGILDYEEFFARYNFTHIFVTTVDLNLYQLLSHDENYRLIFEYELPDGNGHGRIFIPVIK